MKLCVVCAWKCSRELWMVVWWPWGSKWGRNKEWFIYYVNCVVVILWCKWKNNSSSWHGNLLLSGSRKFCDFTIIYNIVEMKLVRCKLWLSLLKLEDRDKSRTCLLRKWKLWVNYVLGRKLVYCVYLMYIRWKWYDMPPNYVVVILISDEQENGKIGLEV